MCCSISVSISSYGRSISCSSLSWAEVLDRDPTLSASVDVAENHHFTQDLSMSAVSCPELS